MEGEKSKMNEETPKKKLRNFAIVEGWLRENYLKAKTTKTGKPYIQGEVVISTSRFNAQRVRVRVFATKGKAGAEVENEDYKNLMEFVNGNVSTIASYAETLPEPTHDLDDMDERLWEAATHVASKVWFSGSLEEYVTITEEGGKTLEKTTFSIEASKGGIRREGGKRPFSPRCAIEMDGSILSMRDEVKKNEEGEPVESGRVVMDYVYIDYKGVAHKFKLYAGTDPINPTDPKGDTFAEYVKDHYAVGDTAQFNFTIANLMEREEKGGASTGWGKVAAPVVITHFTRELQIYGGRSAQGFSSDYEGYIAKEDITKALAQRQIVGKDNALRAAERKAAATKSEVSKGFGFPTGKPGEEDLFSGGDIDF